MARYGVGRAYPTASGHFPWATFAINTSGAFVLGFLLAAILERWRAPWYLRPLTCVGFLGAWTTMSTLAFEADLLTKDGHSGSAVAYLLATLFAGLVATALGVAIGRPRTAAK
jgi:CrcB protein